MPLNLANGVPNTRAVWDWEVRRGGKVKFGMRRRSLAVVLASAVCCCADVRFPIVVAQDGTQIDFVHVDGGDAAREAIEFCARHMPTVDAATCATGIVEQLAEYAEARTKSRAALPGLSFQVANAAGEKVEFSHAEGADPAEEARLFCGVHFAASDPGSCVEAMLLNMQRAYEEAADAAGVDLRADTEL